MNSPIESPSVSYVEEFRVPFGDTDGAGVVFYPNYYRWFDRMTHELFRSIGHAFQEHLERQVGAVLAETHCEFIRPIRYDDVVRLEASVEEVRNRGFRIKHQISLGKVVAARGYEVRVWVDLSGRSPSPQPIPANMRAALLGVSG